MFTPLIAKSYSDFPSDERDARRPMERGEEIRVAGDRAV